VVVEDIEKTSIFYKNYYNKSYIIFLNNKLDMNFKKIKAFTLVELIVVITILAILWTIAFISLQWYSKIARDSVRISDLSNIEKQLEIRVTIGWKLPIPENKVDITASWTIISYQGYAWENTLNNIWVHNWWKDPLNDEYYTYVTNVNLNKYEILWFLENQLETWINNNIELLSKWYAIDYTTRIPIVRWNNIWVLLSSIDMVPIQKTSTSVDVINTTTEYKVYLNNSDDWIITGTWNVLEAWLYHRINEIWSCNTILKNWKSIWNGIYKIDPENDWIWFNAYCDMVTDWGGWTLLVSQVEPNYFSEEESEYYVSDGVWLVNKYSIMWKRTLFEQNGKYTFLYRDDSNNEDRWQIIHKNWDIWASDWNSTWECVFWNNYWVWSKDHYWSKEYCIYTYWLSTWKYVLYDWDNINTWYWWIVNLSSYATYGFVTFNWKDENNWQNVWSTKYSFWVR